MGPERSLGAFRVRPLLPTAMLERANRVVLRSSTFHVAGGLLGFEPVWEAYITEVFTRCAEVRPLPPTLDSPLTAISLGQRSLSWFDALPGLFLRLLTLSSAECRINFLHDFMVSSSGHLDLPHRAWVSLFQRAIETVKASSNPAKPFWGARIIYSTIRFVDPGAEKGQLRWYMEDCIALKKEFPDFIAGELFFDCVLRRKS